MAAGPQRWLLVRFEHQASIKYKKCCRTAGNQARD